MTTHLTRLYDRIPQAQSVVDELRNAGIPNDDITLIANGDANLDHTTDAADGASAGAGLGAAVGGGAGLLAGLGVMAIPGVGPIVAAGWMAATLTGLVAGAVTGAAAGGMIGALTDNGVDDEDAHVYAESLRRGGSMVIVKTDELRRAVAETVLDRHPSVTVSERRSVYEGEGWNGFDEKSEPYTRPGQVGTRHSPVNML
jgi:hypothetical protein